MYTLLLKRLLSKIDILSISEILWPKDPLVLEVRGTKTKAVCLISGLVSMEDAYLIASNITLF